MTRPARLDAAAAQALATSLPGWALAADGNRSRVDSSSRTSTRRCRTSTVSRRWPTQHDHHPDLKVGYNYCEVLFTTHDADGLTELDAICARAAQQLVDAAALPKSARE